MDGRTKNSIRNIVWGLINRGIGILFPFIMRTLLIYVLGVQYIGLGSLFASILGVLSLAELGFGGALVFSMYKPAMENNYKDLSALLFYYRKCYRIIGCITLCIGMLIISILPYLIKGSYPKGINLYLLYLIYLSNTVISYFMYAYKGSVLTAYQRNDIKSNIASVLSIIQYAIQIALLLLFENYYVYIIVTPIITVANNLLVSYFVDKFYPEIKCAGEIDKAIKKDITQKVKGMAYQRIGGIVLSSVDSIIISAFLGLTILATYNNYYLIITSLFGILGIVMSSIIPSVGNMVNTESNDKNYKAYRMFNLIYVWMVSWCTVCLLCLYQHFVGLWVGEKLLLPTNVMFLCVIYFFIHKWMDMNYVYQEAVGLWWENRYVPLIASLVNLIINIVLVQIIGLSGILISTIVSVLLIYNTGFIYVLYKKYFHKPIRNYITEQMYYLFATILAGVASFWVCSYLSDTGILWLLIKAVVCLMLPNIILLLLYCKLPVFRDVIYFLKGLQKGRKE